MKHFLSYANLLAIAVAALTLAGCSVDPAPPSPYTQLIDQPPGFPAQAYPADNVPNDARVDLGRLLFYSPLLSSDSTVACVNCHYPQAAFTGRGPTSMGSHGRMGTRNSPTLANIGYKPHYLMEGGVPTLEMQVLVPVQEHAEFDMTMPEVVSRFKDNTTIQRLSKEAYDRPFDAWVLTRAIASFERTFVSGRSRADQGTLTLSERRGRDLFFSSRTNCSSCHGGFLYSTYAFANNGAFPKYTDPGRARLTGKASDSAVFVIPSLRNVEATAPYMHDGSIWELSEVINLYNRGGFPHPNKSPLIKPLGLSNQERSDLENFLRSLTDASFLNNPRFHQ